MFGFRKDCCDHVHALKVDVQVLSNDVSKIKMIQDATTSAHTSVTHDLESLKGDVKGLHLSLTQHMEEEMKHHEDANKIQKKTHEAIKSLVEEQSLYRIEREKRERLKSKRNTLLWSVLTAVLSTVSIGVVYWLFEVITNLDKVNKAIGVE